MLDPVYVRDNPELVSRAAADKHFPIDIQAFLDADDARRELIGQVETLRADQNKISQSIKTASHEDRPGLIAQSKTLKTQLAELDPKLAEAEARWTTQLLKIPAVPLDEVPVGKDDTENVLLKTEGVIRPTDETPRSHIDLAEAQGWIDFERGAKTSGSKMTFVKGELAELEQAVMRFAADQMIAKGYTLVLPPVMVREPAMVGTGYFPGGEEQAYSIPEDQLFLTGTSEVPICAMHMDEMLDGAELPLRYVGWSLCFRREAGTYGRDTKGLYRIHQFQKVEQVIISAADRDESRVFHSELQANAEAILQALELPYRVVVVCTGDLGMGQVYKTDIEVWMPSRESYGETHSCSMFYDYQARRLNLRYREGKTKAHCFTLNNTAIAAPRALIAILENHQLPDGRVQVPAALQPYLGGRETLGVPL